jgi:lipopolysaccharide transport system ATP-binding protein
MDKDFAIKVENVSKKYSKSLKRSMLYGIKDIARNTFGLSSHSDKLRKNEFWALDNISFEVKKGETLGIIGPNGSGKTTLLKLLNGIFWPDIGKITIKGKVGALIEVGAGFHPLLTGRENIYINAAILGMTKEETDKKFDAIVEFADIGDFLDVPVKHYSSGMFVRLGFAVAAHCEPDILLVDEVLAVGDANFRHKCLTRIGELVDKNISVIIVSHNLEEITRIANSLILLNSGRIVIKDLPSKVVKRYFEILDKDVNGNRSYFTNLVRVIESKILDTDGNETSKFKNNSVVVILVKIVSKIIIKDVSISYGLWSNSDIHVAGSASSWDNKLFTVYPGFNTLKIKLHLNNLKEGIYFLDFGLWDNNLLKCYLHIRRFKIINIENSNKKFTGIVNLKPMWDVSK